MEKIQKKRVSKSVEKKDSKVIEEQKQNGNKIVVSVINKAGELSKIELPKELVGQSPNTKLLAQYVHIFLQNQRQGNASTKNRSEVIGSTKKIYKQKGTGKARHGSKKAPIFVGGGVSGGPKPRSYSLSMNKQMKQMAFTHSLSLKNQEGSLRIIDTDIYTISPKTKVAALFLQTAKLFGKKILFITAKNETMNFVKAMRNIPTVRVILVDEINPYTILNSNTVCILKDVLPILEKRYI